VGRADLLYAGIDKRVYELRRIDNHRWRWTDIGAGLPPAPVYDLSAQPVTDRAGRQLVLIRSAVASRGIYESARRPGDEMVSPPESLYMRNSTLDLRWLSTDTEVPGTLSRRTNGCGTGKAPTSSSTRAIHQGTASAPSGTSRDPEASFPLTHIQFELLGDNSRAVPAGSRAWVDVQVHNRHHTASGPVSVWALACPAAAGVPSPWKAVGNPQVVEGIKADRPRIVSWSWSVPTLPPRDDRRPFLSRSFHSLRREPFACRNGGLGRRLRREPAGCSKEPPLSRPCLVPRRRHDRFLRRKRRRRHEQSRVSQPHA